MSNERARESSNPRAPVGTPLAAECSARMGGTPRKSDFVHAYVIAKMPANEACYYDAFYGLRCSSVGTLIRSSA